MALRWIVFGIIVALALYGAPLLADISGGATASSAGAPPVVSFFDPFNLLQFSRFAPQDGQPVPLQVLPVVGQEDFTIPDVGDQTTVVRPPLRRSLRDQYRPSYRWNR